MPVIYVCSFASVMRKQVNYNTTQFMVRTEEGLSFISIPNFKRIALFVPKIISGSQNLEIRSWPRPRPLRGRLYSVRRRVPSSTSVPNLKRIAQFFQTLLRGSPKFRN